MRAKDAVGKRIVRIEQEQQYNSQIHQLDWVVREIELEDGTLLRPYVMEFGDGYGVNFVIVNSPREENNNGDRNRNPTRDRPRPAGR